MLTALIVFLVICGLGVVAYVIYNKYGKAAPAVVIPVPVTPVPIIPIPILIKPTPPFPSCPFGPKPTDASGLMSYLGHYSSDLIVKVWYDWLIANPTDLDWAWSEYIKTNS